MARIYGHNKYAEMNKAKERYSELTEEQSANLAFLQVKIVANRNGNN